MNEVKIDIRVKRKKQQVNLQVASAWNECPHNIYPQLAQIYLMPDEVMDWFKKSVSALTLICGEAFDMLKTLNGSELYSMLPLVEWVFSKVDMTLNDIPIVTAGDQEAYWYAPANGLKNMRFSEWCVADTLFVEYSKTQNINILNRLVATLYRPAGDGNIYDPDHADYRGDERERFNDSLLDKRQAIAAWLPKSTKSGIYLWFAVCRQAIINQYPEVFPQEKQEGGNDQLAAYGWFGVYDDLRGDPKFGGPDKLEEEFIHTVFSSVSRAQIKYREFKRENKL